MHRLIPRSCITSLALLAMGCGPEEASAPIDPKSVHVEMGPGGMFRDGSWTRVLVKARTAGELSLIMERSPGRLDLLRVTPLSGGQIIRGKLYAILFGGLCFLAWDLVAIGIFWLAIYDRFKIPHIDPVLRHTGLMLALGILPAGLMFSLFSASLGLFAAAILRRAVSALVLANTVVLILALGAGLLFIGQAVDPLTGNFRETLVLLAILGTGLAGWILLRLTIAQVDQRWLRE